MMRTLLIALYLATLGLVTTAWWPNMHKLAFVEGKAVYAGWEALWQMLPLLVLVVFTAGLGIAVALLAVMMWADRRDEATADVERVKKERATQERVEQIVAQATRERDEAKAQTVCHRQAADAARTAQGVAETQARETRQRSEKAHRNVREQLQRLRQQNAKLKGY